MKYEPTHLAQKFKYTYHNINDATSFGEENYSLERQLQKAVPSQRFDKLLEILQQAAGFGPGVVSVWRRTLCSSGRRAWWCHFLASSRRGRLQRQAPRWVWEFKHGSADVLLRNLKCWVYCPLIKFMSRLSLKGRYPAFELEHSFVIPVKHKARRLADEPFPL